MTWRLVSASAIGSRRVNDDAQGWHVGKHRKREHYIAAIADGVGSRHGSGVCASAVVDATISDLAAEIRRRRTLRPFSRADWDATAHRIRQFHFESGAASQAATLASFALQSRSFMWFSLGDSRVYSLHADHGLMRLSADQVDTDGALTSFVEGDGRIVGNICGSVGVADDRLLALCLTTDGVHTACSDSEIERFLAFVIDRSIRHARDLENELIAFLGSNLSDNASLAIAYRTKHVPMLLRRRIGIA